MFGGKLSVNSKVVVFGMGVTRIPNRKAFSSCEIDQNGNHQDSSRYGLK